ncbi:MAG: hypothetical protein JWM55_596 [Acidimicrobiaceae bacterium]|nr:hypothetical protein [Acidimicrobiaceae bacterium]
MTQIAYILAHMIEKPYSIGRRIAEFRKRLPISADKLATEAGQGLTRSVIANLESGRKHDLSVQQLLAIAYVLGVSPSELVFDSRYPHLEISLSNGESKDVTAESWRVSEWFGGVGSALDLQEKINGTIRRGERALATDGSAHLVTQSLRRRNTLLVRLLMLVGTSNDEDGFAEDRRDARAELYEIEKALRARGVHLSE